MYIDNVIKKEVLTLIVSVVVLVTFLIGIAYSTFFSIDKDNQNITSIEDLKLKFCDDLACKSIYNNLGQVIGTKTIDGISYPIQIFSFSNINDVLNTDPYIFNIKNTNKSDVSFNIKLVEDKDYILPESYHDYLSVLELYSNHVKVGISDCSLIKNKNNINMYTYGELENNTVFDSVNIKSKESKTFCLWTWLDESTPKDIKNIYFVANINIEVNNNHIK